MSLVAPKVDLRSRASYLKKSLRKDESLKRDIQVLVDECLAVLRSLELEISALGVQSLNQIVTNHELHSSLLVKVIDLNTTNGYRPCFVRCFDLLGWFC